MKLTELIAGDFFLPPEWNREFNHIVTDSRDVQKGDVFIARRGLQGHGDEYIKAAVDNGAIAVLAEGDMGFRCESSPHFPMVPVFLHRKLAATCSNGCIAVTTPQVCNSLRLPVPTVKAPLLNTSRS